MKLKGLRTIGTCLVAIGAASGQWAGIIDLPNEVYIILAAVGGIFMRLANTGK